MVFGFDCRGILYGIPILLVLLAVGIGTAQVLTDSDVRVALVAARVNMRALAQGIEAYQVDHGIYPYDGYNAVDFSRWGYWYPPSELTTPTAYVDAAFFEDPFPKVTAPPLWWQTWLRYANTESTWGDDWDAVQTSSGVSAYLDETLIEFSAWRLWSVGPDGLAGPGGWPGPTDYPDMAIYQPYDPTNGLMSEGDIIRTQANALGYPYMEFQSAVMDAWRLYD